MIILTEIEEDYNCTKNKKKFKRACRETFTRLHYGIDIKNPFDDNESDSFKDFKRNFFVNRTCKEDACSAFTDSLRYDVREHFLITNNELDKIETCTVRKHLITIQLRKNFHLE